MYNAYRSRSTIHIVMELVKGTTLFNYATTTGPMSIERCKSIVKQVLTIIEYLHSDSVSICHRDLTPNNVMITVDENNDVKVTLIDFNVSRHFRSKDTLQIKKLIMMTQTGAPSFQAPEV